MSCLHLRQLLNWLSLNFDNPVHQNLFGKFVGCGRRFAKLGIRVRGTCQSLHPYSSREQITHEPRNTYFVHGLEGLLERALTQPRLVEIVLPQQIGVAEDQLDRRLGRGERRVRAPDNTSRPDHVEYNLRVKSPIAGIMEYEHRTEASLREIYALEPPVWSVASLHH